jgi:alpha-L-arabinofuranosidase
VKNLRLKISLAGLALLATIAVNAQPATISVDLTRTGHKIPETLWGIFFEDINMSTDGGIYPELVRNRSFEDADTPENWKFTNIGPGTSEAIISTADVHGQPIPLNAFNRKSLRLKVDGAFTLDNEGYWGMNIVSGESYAFKLAARGEKFEGKLTVKILSSTGEVLASADLSQIGSDWKYQTLNLTATGGDPKGKLEISGEGKGTLFFDMVSLMPNKTWKNHGLRTDLAESLDALHPKFLRFPGGCWVEGDDFAHMNHWKNTVGDLDVRTPLWNIWGYNATQGLGFYEYLRMAEDLGAEPLFCINIGMSHKETIPMERMAQWVQDALDAIEYANGPTNSVWGSMRAAAGHPAPFNLKYLEIGNENGGYQGYVERWNLFYKAIKEKYPHIIFVADGWADFDKARQPDIVDDHYYDTPEWFMHNANLYDKKDRNGAKVFVGEYAVVKNCGLGNLRGAIGEAAFMTGLERNSDEVIMSSYAPLLVNLNHRAWNPDLINFDSSRWYGLPSYYVQRMFSENRGDVTLPIEVNSPTTPIPDSKGMVGVGTWNTKAEYKDIKVTAPDGKVLLAADFSKDAAGWKKLGDGDWSISDGALRQNAEKESVRAIAGDKSWTDYTLTLKARKLGGREGFLILFHIAHDDDQRWWNIGGWNNTQDAVDNDGVLDGKPCQLETGRWYDIRLEVAGKRVKCYLDGQLVHDIDYEINSEFSALYACAAKVDQTGDVLVKVVNTSDGPMETRLNFNGAKNLIGEGSAELLTSANPTDENTIENPSKVSPKSEAVHFTGTAFTRVFPGNSFTVLRLKTKQ